MSSLKSNIYLKVGAVVLITLLLLIPTSMIKSLVQERETIQHEAVDEVTSKWSRAQTISGPFLTIPYLKQSREYSAKDSSYKIITVKESIQVLPDELKIAGNIDPSRRNRGIHEIVVYNSQIGISGNFDLSVVRELEIPIENIQFDKAQLTVGIDDLRGLEQQVQLKWDQQQLSFSPGVVSRDVADAGIHVPVPLTGKDSTLADFSLNLSLKGSQQLYFTPLGKVTDVKFHSAWANPSFNGAFLPDMREISDTGFYAHWNILNLNRIYPQAWLNREYDTRPSSFGIDLLMPVDNYQKVYRAVRYAILFIGCTFLAFLFIEIFNKVFIHPMQYLLVGLALVIFYTLLLSTSEHLPFNPAFAVSAAATLLLIAGYVRAILKSVRLMVLISGILLILYSFIFVVLQLQDYALLIGSIGVFLILALVMYYSRRIDWYNLGVDKDI